jgi:hypothetical protein
MIKKKEKLRRIPRIVNDNISLTLWKRYVTVEEQNSNSTMNALLLEIDTNSYPVDTKNAILKRMIDDGTGFDGYSSAIVTLGYIRNICKYYINKTN